MNICGLKLTHDGAVAVIENNKLVFCTELEKINNNKRYSGIEDTADILNILKRQGLDVSQIDKFSIDGWGGSNADALAIQPRLEIGENYNKLSAKYNSVPYQLAVARYEEESPAQDILQGWKYNGLLIADKQLEYESYLHVAGHVASAYCTSPFALNKEDSYILIWDGGMYPRLYYFDAQRVKIENLGPIFLFIGNTYTIFSQHFGPFKVNGSFAKDNLSVAGKVMAYIALGQTRRELFEIFDYIYEKNYNSPMGFANVFAVEFKKMIEGKGYSDEDILKTFHVYLEEMLVSKLEKKLKRYRRSSRNLCLAGGCALNIKWNSAIRNSGIVEHVYVPPFPNDSGSAIGAACLAMMQAGCHPALDWSVYSGPELIHNDPASGWKKRECSIRELASLIYETKEPVIFLNSKAELGPRALGNRSIIADPSSPVMKELLNQIKIRESYRPVSPICLEDKAQNFFEPGTNDPYMLFDHKVKPHMLERIPAVCHLDGTARLQTVNPTDNAVFAELLKEFEQLSQLPMLCNTSANYNGTGFFPDIYSATEFNRTRYVWAAGMLYEKEDC